MTAHRVVSLADASAVSIAEGVEWLPLRRLLDIEAFGVNAYRARAGEAVVEDHVESPGQEELYVVLAGRATFSVGESTESAPAGTAIFVSDPAVRRAAVAEEDGTVVLAVGGWRDRAYHPLPWEPIYLATESMRAGDWALAASTIEREAGPQLDTAPVQYRLACLHARLGEHERALGEVNRAIEINPDFRRRAETEDVLAPVRDLGGWPGAAEVRAASEP